MEKKRCLQFFLLLMLGVSLETSAEDTAETQFRLLREKMVKEQISDAPDYRDPVKDPRVLTAMRTVPRHHFVEKKLQSAVLSFLVKDVFTIEIVEALALQAEERLKRLKYVNVRVRIGDGYYGWEEEAPFDRIIVTCAASLVPPPLLKQLKPGGKMCIPVGAAYSVQYLTMVEKSETGAITMRKSIPVRFVPLTRSGKED